MTFMAGTTVTSKPHFMGLDGLRGLAALIVAIYHFNKWFDLPILPPHAYLAVDFFFCLSGFVIASAYDDRLGREMDTAAFIRRRLIRLYPMLLLSVMLVAILVGLEWANHHSGNWIDWLTLTCGSLLLLPVGLIFNVDDYPINPPIWSLAFEMLGNFVYGLKIGHRLKPWTLAIVFALLVALAIIPIVRVGSLQRVGFGDGLGFVMGIGRMLYPFATGVLIYRLGVHRRVPAVADIVPAVVLVLMLALPVFQGSAIYEMVSVLVGIPVLVTFGAAARLSRPLEPLWQGMGRLSYPLYLLHAPVAMAIVDIYRAHAGNGALPITMQPLLLGASVAGAWMVLTLYDEPLRAWLTARLDGRRPVATAVGRKG